MVDYVWALSTCDPQFLQLQKGCEKTRCSGLLQGRGSERMQVESPGIGRPDGFSEIEYVVHPIRMFHIKYVFYKRKCWSDESRVLAEHRALSRHLRVYCVTSSPTFRYSCHLFSLRGNVCLNRVKWHKTRWHGQEISPPRLRIRLAPFLEDPVAFALPHLGDLWPPYPASTLTLHMDFSKCHLEETEKFYDCPRSAATKRETRVTSVELNSWWREEVPAGTRSTPGGGTEWHRKSAWSHGTDTALTKCLTRIHCKKSQNNR